MNLRKFLVPVVLFGCASLFAQSSDPVIMTINGKPILKSEFEYVYHKNNSSNSIDKKTLEEYVDLFINFKLKVEEAIAQGIDTTGTFQKEFRGYRDQLAKPYLNDAEADEAVVQEAYDRMKEELNVSHILIRLADNALPADTLEAWNKAQAALKRLAREEFEKVAREVSQDESVVQNGGDIGWITSFRVIYPFETVAYNTPVGEISQPVRTRFGYHIIKVNDKRPSQGELLTAHIMKFTTRGEDEVTDARAKVVIDSLYQEIVKGGDFASLAQTYSDDKGSAANNGELPWFGTGRMVPEFEVAAFALKNKNDISAPVQSAYGWHIIKLLDRKELAPFEELKPTIQQQVKRDERVNRGQEEFVKNLYQVYGAKTNKAYLNDFYLALGEKNLSDSLFQEKISTFNKNGLIEFADKKISQSDFAKYLKNNTRTNKKGAQQIIDDKFAAFVDKSLLDYEDSKLEDKYEDFRHLVQEYHDGILLFEVSNKEVWDKASTDTEGLSTYFKKNKKKYRWDNPHYKGAVVFCADENTLKEAQKIAKKSSLDSISKDLNTKLNNDSVQFVQVKRGLFAKGENKFVDKEIYKSKEEVELPSGFPYYFVTGKNLKLQPENYTDVRGLVTADYQDYLEKEWIKYLRTKYPVVLNEEVLKTVKKN